MRGRIACMMKVQIPRFCGAVPITVYLIAAAAPPATGTLRATGASISDFVAPGFYKTLNFSTLSPKAAGSFTG